MGQGGGAVVERADEASEEGEGEVGSSCWRSSSMPSEARWLVWEGGEAELRLK